MTAETDLLPLYAELQGHPKIEIIKHYARACVSSATEALRAELREAWSAVDSKAGWEWKKRAEQAEARAERLAEALREMLLDTQHKDHDCGDAEWCPVLRARAALDQETTNE